MKLAKFLFGNLVAFMVIALIILVAGLWLRDSGLVNRDLPISLPKSLVIGKIGQSFRAGNILVKIETTGRIAANSLPPEINLSSRAKRGFTNSYLWLELNLSNLGEDLRLDYEGEGQTVQFLLGARKPQPQIVLSLLSRDIQIIDKSKTPLASGILTQKQSWRGVVAFPVSQSMTELSLVLVPIAKFESVVDSHFPAFEIKLPD
jgi:hypothetical protein